MSWFTSTLASSIGKKTLMAVIGIFLGFFIIVHLLGNATALASRALFLAYARHLHAFGPLLAIMELLLLAAFVCHVALALLLYMENRQGRPTRYAVTASAGGRTLASRTMPYTGLAILLFLGVHLVQFQSGDSGISVADVVRSTLQQPGSAFFYLTGILCLALHVSHGFWSLCQSLGLDHPKYSPCLQRLALVLSACIGLTFSLIPLYALLSADFLR